MENVTHLLINTFSNTKHQRIQNIFPKKKNIYIYIYFFFYVNTNKALKCKDAPYGVCSKCYIRLLLDQYGYMSDRKKTLVSYFN